VTRPTPAPEIAILASDLLEAAAMAAPFVDRGVVLTLEVDGGADRGSAPAALIDPRGLEEHDILRRFGVAARARVAAGADLLLVGVEAGLDHFPAAATLGAMHGVATRKGLLAPAWPRGGYTTEGAVQHLHGAHLAPTMLHASLVRQVHAAAGGTWLHPEVLRLAAVRGPRLRRRLWRAWARGTRLPIADAEAAGDLLRLARATLALPGRGDVKVLAGSRALAWAVAHALELGRPGPSAHPTKGATLAIRFRSEAVPAPLRELRWIVREDDEPGEGNRDRGRDLVELATARRPEALVLLGRRLALGLGQAARAEAIEMLGTARGGLVGVRLLDGALEGMVVWMGG